MQPELRLRRDALQLNGARILGNGECPKNRFAQTPDGEERLNYLCAGYKRFFLHAAPKMGAMARLVRSGRPAEHVMSDAAAESRTKGRGPAGRTDPSSCGSGIRHKQKHPGMLVEPCSSSLTSALPPLGFRGPGHGNAPQGSMLSVGELPETNDGAK